MAFAAKRGVIAYWTLGRATEPASLNKRLEEIGVPSAVKPRSPVAALKAAMADVFNRREEMIRPLKNKDRNGYTVILEEKGATENTYASELSLAVDENGEVSVTAGYTEKLWRITEAVRAYRQTASSEEVGRVLAAAVAALDGIALKPTGHIYFLPDASRETWLKIKAAVEDAAVGDNDNTVSAVDFVVNGDTLRDVRSAITAEVAADMAALQEDVKTNELGERALANRAARALDVKQRVQRYEALLGETLQHCRETISAAVAALSVAVAEKEDELFADV